jgi:cbb3-type cytochrome c oxidase subunit III
MAAHRPAAPPNTKVPDMKSLLALLLSALVAAPVLAAGAAPAPAKPDLAKGQEKATQVCAACHTADGTRGSPANPILQGQHADYLAKQLHEFKSGKRKNAVMSGMSAALTDDDIRNIAAFYASKPAPKGSAKNKELVALGEKIYRGGIAAKQVPACAGCHSPNGAGIPAQYPRLSGQHADYTEAQLVSFRSGARGNSAQMVTIAARMSDVEIKAVSDYVAGLR